jgi:hypothetical protein
VRRRVEKVCTELLQHILGLQTLPTGTSDQLR